MPAYMASQRECKQLWGTDHIPHPGTAPDLVPAPNKHQNVGRDEARSGDKGCLNKTPKESHVGLYHLNGRCLRTDALLS